MNEQEPGGAGGGSRFDPTRYLRQLRGRGGTTDYLDVKWRLVWLRSEHPDAQIVTEHISITPEMAIFKATVTIPGGGSASGYGSETPKDFGDFLEKAETKALGRALIAIGYGTQFAQEFGEDEAPD
ncbi:MAG: Phage protein, partial [uncultured Thermomicrobiales bacterium]